MKGWIRLHRKIRNNPIFNDLQLYRLATICLTEAYHQDVEQPLGNQIVKIRKGQFPTGRFDLHQMYNKGLKRKEMVSEKTVWRWLKKLEKLDFLTIKTTNKYSIVTVVNWDIYQANDQQNGQQMTNKRPTDDQQMTTNKNDKELQENIYSVFDHWNKKEIIRHRKLTDTMRSSVKARLEDYSLDEIVQAIDNYSTVLNSDFHYFSYKWTLKEFLNPKNLDRFLDENKPLDNWRKSGAQPKEKPAPPKNETREEMRLRLLKEAAGNTKLVL